MKIAKDKLDFGYNKPPKIIAEISGNHDGNKSRFLKLIKKACESDADLIKIQTYEPKDITVLKKKQTLQNKTRYMEREIFFRFI
mgnify:CR=1 FL=1